jgi:anti-sigma factor RsiW
VEHVNHEPNDPRWLKLAASLHADPSPTTLARVRARLATRPAAEPSWVRWLAKPAALAMSAGLLVVSALAGVAWVSTYTVRVAAEDEATFTSVFVGDESSLGLPVSTSDSVTPPDSQGARR